MPRFFVESPIAENARFALDARVAQHVRVLRMRERDGIVLFDGEGGEVPSIIVEIGKRDVWVETQSRVVIERELQQRTTLCVALIANDRFDWLIQKATELGVSAIQPMYSERSQRIPGDVEKRIAHWRGVIIAACEQCGRNRLPIVNGPIPIEEALRQAGGAHKVLMDAEGSHRIESIPVTSPTAVFVGPEGGFSPSELTVLREHCDARLRIGATILRAETAAIAALVTIGM
jgi:16S rRNA (uracil1498-N3)-methyltransferase